MSGLNQTMGTIVLLGASGYVGSAFERELKRQGRPYEALSRQAFDYTRFDELLAYLNRTRPAFLINAAGYTGKPNVDACETARAETLHGNVIFPQTVAQACAVAGIPWGQVASGCIYTGARIRRDGEWRIEADCNQPAVREWVDAHPADVAGFREEDEPNFSFRRPPCSFYSGSKALGEEAVAGVGRSYQWRLRIPFDEWDGPRNYLSKVQRYARVYDAVNSISHLGDFVGTALEMWDSQVPFGIYNMTNPGFVTTRQVVSLVRERLGLDREFDFFQDDAEFYREGAVTPRSNCVLDPGKLLATGVRLRPVGEALEEALERWVPEPSEVVT